MQQHQLTHPAQLELISTDKSELTGRAAAPDPVPKASTNDWEKPLMVAQGLVLVVPHRTKGSTRPPCRARPSRTVRTQNPRAARVCARSHARQMLAAMSEAMPTGEVQRTAVTILPITVLKTCNTASTSYYGFRV